MLKKRVIFLIVFIFLFVTPSLAGMNILDGSIFSGNIPQPRLIEPNSDTVDLSGKEELVFIWSPHEGDISQRKYYDFRLYEGYQALGPNLLLKKRVSPNKHEFSIEAGLFKEGAIYTWSLRQKYISGKSRRSTNSFKVIKK